MYCFCISTITDWHLQLKKNCSAKYNYSEIVVVAGGLHIKRINSLVKIALSAINWFLHNWWFFKLFSTFCQPNVAGFVGHDAELQATKTLLNCKLKKVLYNITLENQLRIKHWNTLFGFILVWSKGFLRKFLVMRCRLQNKFYKIGQVSNAVINTVV